MKCDMKKRLCYLIFIIISLNTQPLVAAEPYIDGDFIVIESSGQGRTISEARIQARRNAAQLALGFAVKGNSLYSKTYGERGHLSEHIVTITRAIIGDREKELGCKEENGKYTVTLRVKIRGKELLNGLLGSDTRKTAFDGISIAARAMALERWEKDVGNALIEIIGTFPYSDYVIIEALPRENTFNSRNESLKMDIYITFDKEKYFNEAVPQLTSVLDYVADASIRDIPCLIPVSSSKDERILVKLPIYINTINEYMTMMELEDKNKYIEADGGGFANIYIMTKDYYFNAYRVCNSAFVRLIEALFISGQQGQINMNRWHKVSLNLDFLDQTGNVFNSIPPVNVSSICSVMLFINTSYPLNIKKHTSLDESHHALFILPAIGLNSENYKNYSLFQKIEDTLSINISAKTLVNLGKGATRCRINFE